MENFVLYDEIGQAENCIIYKGRRKGTVIFLAIYCVEKSQRAEVTNRVRLTHEVKHDKIQQFHEWYETSNHLWLVLELCTGGPLGKVIEQDGALPESCVRDFGTDLAEGLHAIHSLGLVFCDLRPSKILLDGDGGIKYSDFSLARVEGENLEDLLTIFGQQAEGDEESEYDSANDQTPTKHKTFNKASPYYMAPEVIQGGPHTQQSDLWSLGCVLHELFTGHKPFEDDSFSELVNKIIHVELPPPVVKGSRLSAKPSPDLVDLLNGLLKKDPTERLHWDQVITHPFWHESLRHLSSEPDSISASIRIESDARCATPLTKRASSNLLEHTKAGSVLGYIKDVELRQSLDRPLSTLAGDMTMTGDGSISETLRPKSRHGVVGDVEAAKFTMSNRPSTAQNNPDEEFRQTRPSQLQEFNVSEIVYYTSDWVTSNISDNPKIQKLAALKFDQKSLPLQAHNAEKLGTISKSEREKHLNTLCDLLKHEEKGPPSQKRAHLLTYATVVCNRSPYAEFFANRNLINLLTKQLKDVQHIELKLKISRLIGAIASNCDEVKADINHYEAITMLTEMLRENFRNAKLKTVLLPALGELLFLIARIQEHSTLIVRGSQQTIPSLTYTMVLKCLKEGDDTVAHHYAAKIIENIVATNTDMCQRFVSNEVGQSLWYLCTHSAVDAPRITALMALCRITKHTVGIFENVIEKAGFPNLLNMINVATSVRIQQAFVTMLCEAVSKGQHRTKYLQHKELVTTALHLLESTSCVVRAKAFILIYIIIKEDNHQLLALCQTRLLAYVERDKKKHHQTEKVEQQNQVQYLMICLNTLLGEITYRIPLVLGELLQLLNSISGRRHLSNTQAKQMKQLMPVVQVLQSMVNSSVFRSQILDKMFILSLARLVEHSVAIDNGNGTNSRDEFVHSVLTITEVIIHHPSIIAQYQDIMTLEIMRSLTQLCLSEQGETKLLSLKLCCELASIFASTESLSNSQQQGADNFLSHINAYLLPEYEQLLMDLNPIPSYSLRLLENIISFKPIIIKELMACKLIPILIQIIEENQSNPTSQVLQHSIAVFSSVIHYKETDLNELYGQVPYENIPLSSRGGASQQVESFDWAWAFIPSLPESILTRFVDLLVSICQRVIPYLKERTDQSDIHIPSLTLISTLEAIHHLLKLVSEVVRKGLQAQKGGDSDAADTAEDCLHSNRQFADVISLLPAMVAMDDAQVSDLSLRVLSLLVQLFAGENKNALEPENLAFYNETLSTGDSKRQKFILRIIKRLVSTDKVQLHNLKTHGSELLKTLNKLTKTASAHADAGLTSMAQELLKLV